MVRVISRSIIKPSSPTPAHLRTLKLSLLDQITPDNHVNWDAFFLPPSSAVANITKSTGDDLLSDFLAKSQHLKEALSQTLTRFYPLCGRYQGNSTVACNDEGVVFVESQTGMSLSDFLKQPDMDFVDKHLLPTSDPETNELSKGSMLLINFILFSCGGTAISLSMSHKIADLVSFIAFLQSWSFESQGISHQILPDFTSGPSLLPARSDIPNLKTSAVISPKKFSTTRLVFDASEIGDLKAQILTSLSKEGKQFYPSRVEVVSALIWKSAMDAQKSATGSFKPSALIQAANLRTRITPPMSETAMGNLLWMYPVIAEKECEMEIVELVKKLRDMRDSLHHKAAKFNREEVGGLVLQSLKDREENSKNLNNCICASWCKFPLSDADFGWGKPVWVTSIAKNLMANTVYLMDTKEEGGVEALVHLEEQEMGIFRKGQEIFKYAAINPSVI